MLSIRDTNAREGARRALVVACALLLSLTLATDARGGAKARPRKGQVTVLDGRTVQPIRVFRGKERGDAFATSFGSDVLPVAESRGGLLFGTPGVDGGAGGLSVVDRTTRQTYFTVAAGEVGSGLQRFGHRVANLGHVQGSKVQWAVSAPGGAVEGKQRTGAASVHILHARGDTLGERVRIEGEAGSLLGWSLLALDDLSLRDSFKSFFVAGAPRANPGRNSARGVVHAHDSVTGGRLWSLSGPRGGEHFGYSLAWGSDVDGDALEDVWVGAPGTRNGRPAGRVYLVSGRTGAILRTFDAPAGARLFGYSVLASDLDRNGQLEVIVGAPATAVDGLDEAGRVYVFDAAGNVLRTLDGAAAGEWFGVGINFGSDHDGDGAVELGVTSLDHTGNPKTHGRGRASIVSSASGVRLGELVGRKAGDYFGVAFFRRFSDLNDDDVTDWMASVTRQAPAFIPD